jgi:hypothetical protein
MTEIKEQKGFIALVSLLIVATAALTIGIAVSLRGIEEIQMSFDSGQAAKARNLAEACIEEGLEKLRANWANYSASLSVGTNFCIINTEADVNNAILYSTGSVDSYEQKIRVQVNNNLEVVYWKNN